MFLTLKKIGRKLFIKIGKLIEKIKFPEDPIIIVACPRSGTTMLLSILSAHPKIHAINKQTYAFDKWKVNEKNIDLARPDRLYGEFLRQKIEKTTDRWCEKTPKHLENIDKIIEKFPNYKIINIVRDARDVCTSKHPFHKKTKYWVSPNRWKKYVKIGLKYSHNKNVYTIRYEDLIDNYFSEIKRLLKFLNLEYTIEMENWQKNAKFRKSKHLKTEIKRLHTNSIGRWRDKEHEDRINQIMNDKEIINLLIKLNYLR